MSSATPSSQCRIQKAQGRGSHSVSGIFWSNSFIKCSLPLQWPKWDDNREVSRLGWGVQVNQVQCFAQLNTHGLGFRRGWSKELMSPYRKQVTNKIGEQKNQNLVAKAAQQSLQGRWTRREGLIQRDMSFNSLLRFFPCLVSFILGVTFDTIGFPAIITRWGLSDEKSCSLCDANKCTVTSLPVALSLLLTVDIVSVTTQF